MPIQADFMPNLVRNSEDRPSRSLLIFFLQDKTREQWQIVFYIAAAIYGIGALFYTAFASGEVQPWAKPDENMELEINITELQPLENGGVKEKKKSAEA